MLGAPAGVFRPTDVTDHVNRSNALRYYLLREIRSTEDGDFILERFIRAYNANLADQLGNLLSRVVGMVSRYYDGVVPAPGGVAEVDRALIAVAEAQWERIDSALARFVLHEALAAIWELIASANKYVIDVRPWELVRQRQADAAVEERLRTVLYNLIEVLRLIACACTPFLPGTAETISYQLGIDQFAHGAWRERTTWGRYVAGTRLQPSGVLFPRLELPATAGTSKEE